jgi:sigma-E factor negative regulatory protein RseC
MVCVWPRRVEEAVIEETALVISCDGDMAQVEAERRATCGACSERDGCGTSLLVRTLGRQAVQMLVRNPLQVQPGERVVVGVGEKGLVQASLLVYALPLAGLILFAILGQLAAERLLPAAGELPSILCGLLGLTAGLALARHRSANPATGNACRAVILRRAEDPGRSLVRS